MPEVLFVTGLSMVSASLFLRFSRKDMWLPLLISLAAAAVLRLFTKELLSVQLTMSVGILVSGVIIVLRKKRFFSDAIIYFGTGGSLVGLWTAYAAFSSLFSDIFVFYLFGLFYLLHIPAVFLNFRRFSIAEDWEGEIRKEEKIRSGWIPFIGLAMSVLVLLVSLLPSGAEWVSLCQMLIATFLFWAGTGLMALLVAYGKKSEQSSTENDYYQSMRSFMNVVRSQRHDYNLHVQTVASLIQQEKWEACRTYVNALALDTEEMNTVLPVQDPAVAALIHNYRMKASSRGIPVLMDIRDDMTKVVTNAYETNKIIGNLLQNALDELERQKAPDVIELGIYKRGEFCLVRVSNRVEDPTAFSAILKEIFEQGYTTKQGHDGVGLSSIRVLAQRVGGDVSAWLENDMVHFVASIPMHL